MNSDSKPRSSAHCAKSAVGMDESVTTVTIPNFSTRLSLLVTEALVSSVTAMDELVHRLRWIQHLRGDFAAPDGKRSIDEVQLDEQRSLVPVEVLAHDPVAFESDDGHDRDLHALSGRLDAGQEPVHANRVREADDQLIDDLALSYGSRDRHDFDVRRQLWQEVCRIEVSYAVAPSGADHQWDQVDVGVLRHRRHGLIRVLRGELGAHVLVPHGRQRSFGFHVVCSFRVSHGKESLGPLPRDAARVLGDAGRLSWAHVQVRCSGLKTRQPPLPLITHQPTEPSIRLSASMISSAVGRWSPNPPWFCGTNRRIRGDQVESE